MYYVKSKLVFEGVHHWKKAPNRVSFLREEHRHQFTVIAKKEVTHGDRDTEFIILKHIIQEHIQQAYEHVDNIAQLGSTSCEMLAESLVNKFDLLECEVLEDNENSGGYIV